MSHRNQSTFSGNGKYDPNRHANGHFVKGHKLRTGVDNAMHRRFNTIRTMWLEIATPEDTKKVWDELIGLCLGEKTPPDVKLKSIVYALDRLLGRPQESIELQVNGAPVEELADLTKDELRILQRVVGRSQNSRELLEEPSPADLVRALSPSPSSAPPPSAPNTPSGG